MLRSFGGRGLAPRGRRRGWHWGGGHALPPTGPAGVLAQGARQQHSNNIPPRGRRGCWHFGAPSRGSWPWPHTELFRRSKWQGPRASPGQISLHPSRGSWPWPHRGLHRRPTEPRFRHAPHEGRGLGPIRSFSDGPSDRIYSIT